MSDLYEDGDRGSKPMHLIKKEGVTLAYQDINPDLPPMLFVHGWGCDHTALAPQAEFFRHSHRVVRLIFADTARAMHLIRITRWPLLRTTSYGCVPNLR